MSDLRRLVSLVLPYWPWLVLGALLGVIAVGSNIALMGLSAYLISKAAIAASVAELALAVTGVRALAICRAGFRYLERYSTHRAMFRLLTAVRVWSYQAVEPLAPARLERHRSGDLLARYVADVDGLEDFWIRAVIPPIVAAVVVAVMTIAYGSFDPAIGLVLLLFLVLSGVLLPLLARRLARMPASSVAAIRGEVAALTLDQVDGVAELVVLDAAADHRERLLRLGRGLDETRRRLSSIEGMSNVLAGLFASLAALAILALAVPLVTAGDLDGVFLAALPLAAIASFEAVQPLARSLQLLDTTRGSARRLFELVDDPPPVAEPAHPAALPETVDLDIEALTFRYAEDEPPVLEGFTLHLPAGDRVALVGPSGSGKSTLVSLLVRFREYQHGRISIGGRDLRDLRSEDVRSLIGVVPQDVHLFDTTIRDNLLIADGRATDEQLERACRTARLWDFVTSLPDGLGTRVGEQGLQLSGGERRRLAIARVILKDAPLLVLDEPTADLDSGTEAELWRALRDWMKGRSALLISHRPVEAAGVGRVIRLDLPLGSAPRPVV